MSSKTFAVLATEHDSFPDVLAGLDSDFDFDFEPSIDDLIDPEDDTPATPVALTKPVSEHVPGSHIEMPTGRLRLPFHGGDYVAASVRGSGCVKLIDSAVAPLVAAARGYFTYGEGTGERDLAEAITERSPFAPRKGSDQAKRLQYILDNPRDEYGEDILGMPWTSLEEWVTFHTGLSDTLIPSTMQFKASHSDEDAVDLPNKYEFMSGKSTPLDVNPGVPLSYRKAPAILIAEGMLKADAALTAFLVKHHGIDLLRYDDYMVDARAALAALMEAIPEQDRVFIISIGGVQNWKQCPDWSSLAVKGRKAWLGIDGDTATNLAVWKATNEMRAMLSKKGALVSLLEPRVEGVEKPGIDEYLSREGDWDALIATATKNLPPAPDKKQTAADKAREAATSGFSFTSSRVGDVPDPSVCEETSTYPLTHLGLGERVERHFGHVIAYDRDSKQFIVYVEDGVWEYDEGDVLTDSAIFATMRSVTVHEAGHAERRNEEVIEAQRKVDVMKANNLPASSDDLKKLADAKKAARKATEDEGKKWESTQGALTTAKRYLRKNLSVSNEVWDAHTLLVNGPDSTYHVGKRELREHRPGDRITMRVADPIDLDAQTDDVDDAIAWLDEQQEGLSRTVLRLSGMSLTGVTDAKVFASIFGVSNAAKSTWIEGFYYAAGGRARTAYGVTIDANALSIKATRSGSGHSDALDRCAGKRFVIADEAQRVHVDSDWIKRASAGGTMTTSSKGGKNHDWKSYLTLWTMGNGPFNLPPEDAALINRLLVVEMAKAVPMEKMDPMLMHRLQTDPRNRQAIIAAALHAASDWFEEYRENRDSGVKDPAKVALHMPENSAVTREKFVGASNPLVPFFDAKAIIGDEDDLASEMGNRGRADSGQWCEYYNVWARANGHRQMKPNDFNNLLTEMKHGTTNPTEFTYNGKHEGHTYKVKVKNRRLRLGMRFASERDWRRVMDEYITVDVNGGDT
jgi:phage/plasmid-associated DNA primase